MAEFNPTDLLNPNDLASSFWQNAPPELLTKWISLLDIGKIAGIVIIAYFIILIIARILKFRDSRNIRLIKNAVISIEKKLDALCSPQRSEKVQEKKKQESKKEEKKKGEKK
tara:strand:+ start:578 stop:913 length:336 start_codon:yes stop_codon:yes gene_type:complete